MMKSLIVAASQNDVIGLNGSLPWDLPDDLRHFRRITVGHAVIMGRVTHESIMRQRGHPLANRTSIVISSKPEQLPDGVLRTQSVESAIALAQEAEGASADAEIFVIGGASVYRQSLPFIDKIYLTRVHHVVTGDTDLPANWLHGFTLVAQIDRPSRGSGCTHSFLEYIRVSS